jgi:CheY-like chemotaxis protein
MEALGQLSAGVAHDFNNLLSIIDGYCRMLRQNIEQEERPLSFIDKIETASRRGAGLTRRMLTFSRHKILGNEVVDICQVIADTEAMLGTLLNPSVHFEIQKHQPEVFVQVSEDSITQILMNLVTNARDAMPEGGLLRVCVELADHKDLPEDLRLDTEDFVCVSVRDTGMGISESDKDKIFDPFYTSKELGKGTGLGLSVVYGLVKEAGGLVTVESSRGHGTTFNIFLPVTDKKPDKHIDGSLANIKDISFDGYRAVVAEDEPDLLLIVTDMLEKLGMEVYPAANGNDALALIDDYEDKIDLLLTDMVMPELDGVKLAEMAQAISPKTRIIFMSGYPVNGNIEESNLPEDVYFIAKPVLYDELARLIFMCLKDPDGVAGVEPDGFSLGKWQFNNDMGQEEDFS